MKIKSVFFGIICLLSLNLYGQAPYTIVSVNPDYVVPGQINNLTFILNQPLESGDTVIYAGLWLYYTNSFNTAIIHSDTLVTVDSVIHATFNIPDTSYLDTGIPYLQFNNYSDSLGAPSSIKVGSEISNLTPAICMVSVDTSNKNIITWSNPSEGSVDSIVIYKETSVANNYMKIGEKAVEDIPIFKDTASKPAQQANRYKISFVDTMGNETVMSNAHKTVHLTLAGAYGGTVNLSWDSYEGFDYSTFYIYRGPSKDSMTIIGEVASTLHTYSDVSSLMGKSYYQVAVKKSDPCIIDNVGTDTSSFSKSNYVEYSVVATNIGGQKTENWISIYPNPVRNVLNLHILDNAMHATASLYDMTGRLVYGPVDIFNNASLNLYDLNRGTYLLKIRNDNTTFSRIIVKE